jgi:predicted permease
LTGFAKPLYVLLALAGLVLLLASANLANLLLARATGRQREMSVRLALGAGRAGILRQLLTESLLLSILGGFAGLFLAYLGRNLIPRLLTNPARPALTNLDFDWRVLLFTLVVSLVTGIAFGAVPIWQATRADMISGLKDASHATMGRERSWLGKGLVVLQVSLSTILLLAAGLFVRTLANLNQTPLGFRADHLLLFKLTPPRTRYTDEAMLNLYRRLEEKIVAVPGVRSVTMSNIALIGDGHSGSTFHVSGRRVKKEEERVQTNHVGTDFFQTMAIPIVRGRSFNRHDNLKSGKVAIVNRSLAHRFFPNENPIGRTFDGEDVEGPVEIVGVAADTRYADLRSPTPPTYYIPYQQADIAGRMIVEIRTRTEPFGVLSSVRNAVESLDRDLALIDVRTQEQQVQTTLFSERIFAELTSAFGILAVILAAVGIYGLMAYTVALRTGEIGIRIALGARMGQVLVGVLRDALWMALAGVLIGAGAALWMARFVSAMLFGLKAMDLATLAVTAGLLIAITLLAGFGPARRASRIDPLNALRHE